MDLHEIALPWHELDATMCRRQFKLELDPSFMMQTLKSSIRWFEGPKPWNPSQLVYRICFPPWSRHLFLLALECLIIMSCSASIWQGQPDPWLVQYGLLLYLLLHLLISHVSATHDWSSDFSGPSVQARRSSFTDLCLYTRIYMIFTFAIDHLLCTPTHHK